TIWQFLAAIATLLPYVLASGGFHLHLLDGAGWACLLVMGLVHTGLAYCMYFSALRSLSGQQASILSYIDPLVAVLISVLLLGETMTLWQGIGGAMILGFTLLNETA
ncbi:MAG: EamA family transporter, partial [Clostridia bacterium]|nr:EamA family transporter [Clostridia bacterium]